VNGLVGGGGQVLSGWAIVQSNGLTLIGQHVADGVEHKLRPVYELRPQAKQTPRGMQVGHVVLPMLLLSIREVQIPAGAIVVCCDTLPPGERARLHASIKQGEELADGMRVAASGLSLVRELPPGLPRPDGGS